MSTRRLGDFVSLVEFCPASIILLSWSECSFLYSKLQISFFQSFTFQLSSSLLWWSLVPLFRVKMAPPRDFTSRPLRTTRSAAIRSRGELLKFGEHPQMLTARPISGGTVTHRDLVEWYDIANGIPVGRVVEVYIQMVVHHRNRIPNNHIPQGIPEMIVVPHSFYNNIALPEAQQPAGRRAASDELRNNGLNAPPLANGQANLAGAQFNVDQQQFRQVQYLFVPIHYNGHSSLLVISPRDQTIEFLDANFRAQPVVDRIFIITLHWLAHEYGRDFIPRNWRILTDQDPQQPLQGPSNPTGVCGSYTCCMALELACYQDLDDLSFHGINPLDQRRRIIDELLQGRLYQSARPPAAHPHPNHHDFLPYPGVDRRNDVFEVAAVIPQARILRRLPASVRARTGRWDNMTMAQLRTACRNARWRDYPNGARSQDFRGWSSKFRNKTRWGCIVWMEARALAIAEGRWPR